MMHEARTYQDGKLVRKTSRKEENETLTSRSSAVRTPIGPEDAKEQQSTEGNFKNHMMLICFGKEEIASL